MSRAPLRALKEGDRVEVRTGFASSFEGKIDRDWKPGEDGKVAVVPDGKTKPREFDPARVRLLERPAPERSTTRARLTRRSTYTHPGLKAQPKPEGPLRSSAYLAFVRSQPCCGCRAKTSIQAHHWGSERGLAQKVDDTRTVPLCSACHQHVHDTGSLPKLDVLATRLWFLDKQVSLLTEWLRRLAEAAKTTGATERAEGGPA